MLGWETDITVVAQVDSLFEARELLRNGSPAADVMVVDLDLRDGSGLEFVRDLRSARSEALVLVVTASSDQRQLASAIEAGAAGVMHKSSRFEDIVDAVRRLHAGESLLSQQEIIEALRLITRERTKGYEARLMIEQLTAREREVLQALAEGLGDREISERLYISLGTVRHHLTSILTKLEVQSRLQALIFAVRHDVVRID